MVSFPPISLDFRSIHKLHLCDKIFPVQIHHNKTFHHSLLHCVDHTTTIFIAFHTHQKVPDKPVTLATTSHLEAKLRLVLPRFELLDVENSRETYLGNKVDAESIKLFIWLRIMRRKSKKYEILIRETLSERLFVQMHGTLSWVMIDIRLKFVSNDMKNRNFFILFAAVWYS